MLHIAGYGAARHRFPVLPDIRGPQMRLNGNLTAAAAVQCYHSVCSTQLAARVCKGAWVAINPGEQLLPNKACGTRVNPVLSGAYVLVGCGHSQ